jgi:hypothetical protein
MTYLETWMVRFSANENQFGGRVKIRVNDFRQIPEAIARHRRLPVESIQIESAVIIERKAWRDDEEGSHCECRGCSADRWEHGNG